MMNAKLPCYLGAVAYAGVAVPHATEPLPSHALLFQTGAPLGLTTATHTVTAQVVDVPYTPVDGVVRVAPPDMSGWEQT